jgi:O-antigen/teichoic acid export membrane protein
MDLSVNRTDDVHSSAHRKVSEISRSTAVYLLTSVLNTLASFCISLFIAHVLGKEGLGIYTVALTGTMIGTLIADLGIDSYVLRAFARDEADLGQLLRLKLLSASVVACLTLAAMTVAFHRTTLPFVAAALLVVPRALTGLFEGYLKAIQRRTALATVSSAVSLVAVAIAYGGLAGGLDLGWTMICLLGVETMKAFLLFLLVRPSRVGAGIDGLPVATLLRSLLPFAFIGTVAYVTSRIDVFLLGVLRGAQEAGIYAAADRFLISGNLLAYALYGASFPVISSITDACQRRHVVARTLRNGAVVSSGGAILLFLAAPSLIGLTYQFAESVTLLRVLALSFPAVIVNTIVGSALFALHRERQIAIVLGSACVANIAANVFCIPQYGATGSAAISVLTEYAFSGIYLFLYHRGTAGAVGAGDGSPRTWKTP